MKRASMVVLVTLAAGCGGVPQPTPDYFIDGVGIILASRSGPLSQPDAQPRIAAFVSGTIAWWAAQGYPVDLRGWVIRFHEDRIDCGNTRDTLGCAHLADGILDVSVLKNCIESSPLAHEVGHVAMPDGGPDLDNLTSPSPLTLSVFHLELDPSPLLGYCPSACGRC